MCIGMCWVPIWTINVMWDQVDLLVQALGGGEVPHQGAGYGSAARFKTTEFFEEVAENDAEFVCVFFCHCLAGMRPELACQSPIL